MARAAVLILALLSATLFSTTPVNAESAVVLDEMDSLSSTDLGLNGATMDPAGSWVLAYGEESIMKMINAADPSIQVPMPVTGESALNDADYHPGGLTALIVGEDGVALRYAADDHSVTDAGGHEEFDDSSLTAVAWNQGGSWAYVGSDDGTIWRMRASTDGGAEVHVLEGLGTGSEITEIECHGEILLCVVGTTYDGIAIIDRDHAVHWIGGGIYPWNGMVCPITTDVCVFTSGDAIGMVDLDATNPSSSKVSISEISGVGGVFTGIESQDGDRSMILLTPFSLIEHDAGLNASFPWLENSDVVEFDSTVSGERVVATWATDRDSGWILTDRGTILSFHPPSGDSWVDGLMGLVIMIVFPLVIFGVVLSILMSMSPELSHWVTMKIGSEEEKEFSKRDSRRRRRGRK